MNGTPTLNPAQAAQQAPQDKTRPANPWASDEMLLGLSVWWVRSTRPDSPDFTGEVALVFRDLQGRLQ